MAVIGTAVVATVGLACGVQEHLKASAAVTVSSGGSAGTVPTTGSGGSLSTPGTGGQGTGGVSGGSGGSSDASGGSSSTGGSDSGTGGNSTGSGGRVGTGGSARTGGTMGTGGATGTGGSTSGITINIGGTVVPKEKALVFIHWGHSNMQGHGAKPPELRSFFYDTQPGLWSYRGSNSFVLAKEPTAPSVPTDTGAGPGMAILKTAATIAPTDYQIISIGRGEGSATSVDWLKGNLLYPTVMTRALELKGKVTFAAIFVMMGITERHLPAADQPGFPMRMQQIIAAMRADLGEPNIPVIACDYEMMATGELAPTGAIGTALIPMIRSLPGLITNFVLVPTDGLGMQDDHHFDFAGQKLWSERGIMLMQTKGWFPWRR